MWSQLANNRVAQGAINLRMSGLLHFIRKFVKCNRNPLIPNLLHLHELVNGIALVDSRFPVPGLRSTHGS